MSTLVNTEVVTVQSVCLEALLSICDSSSKQLFAILDACDEPRVIEVIMNLGEERAVSLYSGDAQRDYWAIAPYLVQVDAALLSWVVKEFEATPWGIFIVADSSLVTMRRHFQRFLKVEDPVGDLVLFRFYDPRVLFDFLLTSSPEVLCRFFGEVQEFIVVKPQGELLKLTLTSPLEIAQKL